MAIASSDQLSGLDFIKNLKPAAPQSDADFIKSLKPKANLNNELLGSIYGDPSLATAVGYETGVSQSPDTSTMDAIKGAAAGLGGAIPVAGRAIRRAYPAPVDVAPAPDDPLYSTSLGRVGSGLIRTVPEAIGGALAGPAGVGSVLVAGAADEAAYNEQLRRAQTGASGNYLEDMAVGIGVQPRDEYDTPMQQLARTAGLPVAGAFGAGGAYLGKTAGVAANIGYNLIANPLETGLQAYGQGADPLDPAMLGTAALIGGLAEGLPRVNARFKKPVVEAPIDLPPPPPEINPMVEQRIMELENRQYGPGRKVNKGGAVPIAPYVDTAPTSTYRELPLPLPPPLADPLGGFSGGRAIINPETGQSFDAITGGPRAPFPLPDPRAMQNVGPLPPEWPADLPYVQPRNIPVETLPSAPRELSVFGPDAQMPRAPRELPPPVEQAPEPMPEPIRNNPQAVAEESATPKPSGKEYGYQLTLRPFDTGTVPDGYVRWENDGSKFGRVVYDKPLTPSQKENSSLKPLDPKDPDNLRAGLEERTTNIDTLTDYGERPFIVDGKSYTKDTRRGGDAWRLNYIDENGNPSGHVEFDSYMDARDYAAKMGGKISAPPSRKTPIIRDDAPLPDSPPIASAEPAPLPEAPVRRGKKAAQVSEAPKAKEPWEMTRDEFDASSWLPERPKKQTPTQKAMYQNEAFRIHRSQVQRAFEAGKPVPAEVLADYPDLVKKGGDPPAQQGQEGQEEGLLKPAQVEPTPQAEAPTYTARNLAKGRATEIARESRGSVVPDPDNPKKWAVVPGKQKPQPPKPMGVEPSPLPKPSDSGEKHFVFLNRDGKRVPVAGPYDSRAALESDIDRINSELSKRDGWTDFDVRSYGKTSDPEVIGAYSKRIAERFPKGAPQQTDDPKVYGGPAAILEPITSKVTPEAVAKVAAPESFRRPVRVLEESKPGREAIDLIVKAKTRERMIAGDAAVSLGDVQKNLRGPVKDATDRVIKFFKSDHQLEGNDVAWIRDNMRGYIEAGKKMPNPRIQAYADAWKRVSDGFASKARKLGVTVRENGVERPFSPLPNYFPHMLTDDAMEALQTKRGPLYDAIAKEITTKGIPIEKLDDFISADTIRRSGHLEETRFLPDSVMANGKKVMLHETDPFKVLPKAVDSQARRLAFIETFGQKDANKKIKALREAIFKEQGSFAQSRFDDAILDLQQMPNGRPLPKAVQAADTIATTHMLSMSPLGNVLGPIGTATRFGFGKTVKAHAKSLDERIRRNLNAYGVKVNESKYKAEIDNLERLGAWGRDSMSKHIVADDMAGKIGKVSRAALRAFGLNMINVEIDRGASLAASAALQDAVQFLRKPTNSGMFKKVWGGMSEPQIKDMLYREFELSEADVNRMVKDGIQTEDFARASQRATSKINLRDESPLEKPRWMNHSYVRPFLRLSSYVRSASGQISDALHYAKQGNVAPLARLMFASAVGGTAMAEFRDFLNRKEREDKTFYGMLWRGMMQTAMLGLWGDLATTMYWGSMTGRNAGSGVVESSAMSWYGKIIGEATAEFMSDAKSKKDRSLGEKTKAAIEKGGKAYVKNTPILRTINGQAGDPLELQKKTGGLPRPKPAPGAPTRPRRPRWDD